MTLYINTVSADQMTIALNDGTELVAQKIIQAPRQQGEKLVPAIDSLLKRKRLKLNDITKIVVANRGGSFTSLRIGVITANALAYALNIPVEAEESGSHRKKFASYSLVEPFYDRDPDIGKPKKFKL
ncbi:tRNA (adenosine(37)-N6)-threonylcarbamoyltransferase complex dimerization subunit type 1 TsaB [Candidatus Falkowbacteria bacterium]|uniref:tRNA (Adenosine(37)-N6)-threonylcarbamoyltransferase complex dimerization subunit type 1 TsaB n=1 Tax=Candidatus Falkowbacteria bacterium CG10_big_fil_rev_8_21_14_0_10_37_18 TaxID=1974562 RepID=A0A2H0V978_9BACT|nr:tRNA (adenosine(37)-N6)-threonylcarbamoyltransferase complex dimerization subunit type 1 TsaB [Candidatus Falkowbacteria bacterium]NCQ12675.1 tRNA (adenosine(37)-N6)-threonylcarbamoyltransferase complex dimerization subunit type 1 TsaB [Candidatus Falkowbacteria bacterium]OIO06239.1 MAG: tRNA (adenosine(37)-N6)-threonylcarbamoyltransferase complex dimerization subunit type 1 TsaB [Candidatus Falkowbacteria bacterium CG1_02_37_21]PIR95635.1 MAG: tRNA (adenosine(37)-N6)-threonylcarbamoyltransfe